MARIIRERKQVEAEDGRIYMEPGLLRCGCGNKVEFGEFTAECYSCGALYNWNGTLLAPRDQWEED